MRPQLGTLPNYSLTLWWASVLTTSTWWAACVGPGTRARTFNVGSAVDDDGGGAATEEGVGTSVVTVIGAVIAAVTVLGAAAVVLQGKSSVDKAEKARDAAAAGETGETGLVSACHLMHAYTSSITPMRHVNAPC